LAAAFLSPGGLIAPALVFALSVGLAMAHDPIAARPIANLLDSLSRVLHTINVFITEILGVLLIPISARALHVVSTSLNGGIYSSFLLIMAAASFGLVAMVIPLAIFLLNGRKNPFPLIFSNIPAVLAAFISGNLRFSSGSTIRLARENIGIKRRYNAVIMPTTLIFGRMGTAFIAALSFVIILSSYSQLTISMPSLLLIAMIIPMATIMASATMDAGPIVVLTLSCGFFGRGFENGYLVMVPVALFLSMAAALIDALWMGLAQVVAARRHVPLDPKDPRHFI
jgi:Na+/H+-dicarboxylate symporter